MVTPYILFDKQCEEAMQFYERVFSVLLQSFKSTIK